MGEPVVSIATPVGLTWSVRELLGNVCKDAHVTDPLLDLWLKPLEPRLLGTDEATNVAVTFLVPKDELSQNSFSPCLIFGANDDNALLWFREVAPQGAILLQEKHVYVYVYV